MSVGDLQKHIERAGFEGLRTDPLTEHAFVLTAGKRGAIPGGRDDPVERPGATGGEGLLYGYYGRILIVDLGAGDFVIESLDEGVCERYIGGKGLAAHLLTELNPVGVDPMAPENVLVFATGPLGGSAVWGSCRYGVFTKSPLTGIFAESYAGGRTPDAIDAAGFDAVVIRGRSDAPVVLTVHPGGAEWHSAEGIWGLETYAAEDAVNARCARPEYRRRGAVVIGPAGENGVRFALLKNDYWRSAGRAGAGAVMGSKRLKGILFTGDRRRPHADAPGVKDFAGTFLSRFRDHAAAEAYRTKGTPMLVEVTNAAGAFPTRYWSRGRFEKWERIGAAALQEKMAPTPHACGRCFMACGKLGTVRSGRHAGLRIEGPEYETIYAFGGLCLVDSIEEIAYLNDRCDRLGIDTITAGNLCGLTIEASRRGAVDTRVDYGDVDAIAGLLQRIVARTGPDGTVLSRGIRHAAEKWGLEEIAVHVKGLEPAGYDPRKLKGMGLAYATSDRGACHLRATFYKPELAGLIAPEQIEGKAELFLEFEERLTVMDTLVLCRFYRDFYPWEPLAAVVEMVTGRGADRETLRAKARRIAALIRKFNLREGMRPGEDCLPPALHTPLRDTGAAITREELAVMLRNYYRLQGWDESGVPR